MNMLPYFCHLRSRNYLMVELIKFPIAFVVLHRICRSDRRSGSHFALLNDGDAVFINRGPSSDDAFSSWTWDCLGNKWIGTNNELFVILLRVYPYPAICGRSPQIGKCVKVRFNLVSGRKHVRRRSVGKTEIASLLIAHSDARKGISPLRIRFRDTQLLFCYEKNYWFDYRSFYYGDKILLRRLHNL